MQISGSNIPFSAMQAYGLKKPIAPKQAAPVAVAKPVTTAQRAEQTRDVTVIGSIRPAAATTPTSAASAPKLQSIIAAKVPGAVSFDSTGIAQAATAPSLQLYTRAADRIEAAVAINIGRAIDMRG